jgi:hypothetical protein
MKLKVFKSPENLVILLLAVLNVVIHLLVANNLEYHRDELLYFALGQHPAFGYATVPPLTGWIAWLMSHIAGYSVFAVRLFPAILSGVMVFLIAGIAKELGGSFYARILASLGLFVSIFALRTFVLFQPVHIDLFLWTLIIYLVLRYINSANPKYLIYLGVAAGFAFLNKYLIGLLFLSFLVVVPFTRYRQIFKVKQFWYGILAAFVIFLPNIIWQFVNGLPVINHMAELSRTQLNNVERGAFLIEQLIMPAAGTVLTIAGLIFLFANRKAEKFRFLGIVVLMVIFILFILRGKSYYTIGVLPFLIAAGAVSFELHIKKIWFRILLPALLVLLTIPMLPFGLPVYKADGLVTYFNVLQTKYGVDTGRRFEDGSIHSLPQDYADMLGWEELTMITNKAWQMIENKQAAFIYCENYGQAGAITIIGKKYGLPEAVSFNESFKYWIPRSFDPDITSFIYINDELGDDVKRVFKKITEVGKISNPHAREFGTTVYLCKEPVASFNKFWKLVLIRIDVAQK